MTVRTRAFAALLIAAIVGAALPAAADAGRYHVYSCRTPDGEVAPTDGWKGSVAAGSMADTYVTDTCKSGGALGAALGLETAHAANVDRATWRFEAPQYAPSVEARVWRAGYVHGGAGESASYEFTIAGPIESTFFDYCSFSPECEAQGVMAEPLAQANLVEMNAGASGAGLWAEVACGPGPPRAECGHSFSDANGFAAVVYVYAADITLEQEVGPTADNVGGELAGASSVSGTSDVSFSASDPGSGVYEALFTVDGQVVQRTVLDENGGRCRDVGETTDGLPAFLYVQPCASSVSADVGFDTQLVSNGTHHLVVSVIDAAGNSAPVLDREITVDNPGVPGPPNGTNASANATLAVHWASNARERLTSSFGRAHEITGLLTASGNAPIAGATVEVIATPASVGAVSAAMASVRTDQDGRFTLSVPRSVSSRTLRFAYRAHLGDALPAATGTLVLSVRAGLTLAISPRTTSVGHSIYFRGRLLGGPVPREGKQLVLEARAPGGHWIEFDDVRTGARGRYRASYRFKFPGPADYQFRVLAEPESDYPYAQGASNTIGIHER